MSAPALQPSEVPPKTNLDHAVDLEKIPVDRVLAQVAVKPDHRLISALAAFLVASSCSPNIADANWLARCESANGLRYCEACGTSGLDARNNCFYKCGPTSPFSPFLLILSASSCVADTANLYELKEGKGPIEPIPLQPDGFPPVEHK
jgi:hypothetical protein